MEESTEWEGMEAVRCHALPSKVWCLLESGFRILAARVIARYGGFPYRRLAGLLVHVDTRNCPTKYILPLLHPRYLGWYNKCPATRLIRILVDPAERNVEKKYDIHITYNTIHTISIKDDQ